MCYFQVRFKEAHTHARTHTAHNLKFPFLSHFYKPSYLLAFHSGSAPIQMSLEKAPRGLGIDVYIVCGFQVSWAM